MPDTEYTVVVIEDDSGGYWTEVPSIPGTGSQGETIDEAVSNTKEAITLMLDYLRERGEALPAPRDIVVKVRVPA